jgi:monovalent cation/proton antiporter MnhG/PhaG subunit
MNVRHVVATVLLIAGCGLELLAVLGLVTMRDVLDRLHYVSLAVFGALLVAVGIVTRESFSLLGDKSLLAAGVLVLFGPVLSHATARSLQIRRRGDWRADIEEYRDESGEAT